MIKKTNKQKNIIKASFHLWAYGIYRLFHGGKAAQGWELTFNLTHRY